MSLLPRRDPAPRFDEPSRVVPVDFRASFDADAPPGGRVNIKALVIVGSILVVALIGLIPIHRHQEASVRASALAEARSLADGDKLDRALVGLNHYLGNWPDDIAGLELAASLYTKSARSLDEILNAANFQDQLIRLDPTGPGRQENRRQLVLLYIRHGEGLRSATTRVDVTSDRFGSRFRAAVKIAGQRIAFGAEDADAHRLLGRALEGLATTGDARALTDAIVEYEKALRLDPADIESADRLSTILMDQKKDQAGAEGILDEVLRASPESVRTRLVRYRFFTRSARTARASIELREAIQMAPGDPIVRIAAAGDALRRGDPGEARRNLDAIPSSDHPDPRVRVLRGQIDLYEQHPDEALDAWRKELVANLGSDRELTWQMAQTLIRLGRLAEAKLLVRRFAQMAADRDDPMSRMLEGMLKERTGHPIAAIADLEQCRLSVGEGWRSELEMILGHCYESIGDETRSVGAYRKAIELAPWLTSARMAIARIIARNTPEQAIDEIELALQRSPSDPAMLAELATLRIAQQRALPEESREWKVVDAVLDRGPQGEPNLVRIRSRVLVLRGRPAEALALLESATAGPHKDRPELWIGRANLLSTLGRVGEAISVLDQARVPGILGDHAATRVAIAGLLARSGHARAARDRLTLGVEHLPTNERSALARTLAELCTELGDREGTFEACREWARFSPDDPQPGLYLLGRSMAAGGGPSGDELARQGLALLGAVGGQDEPYALAAKALDLMLSNRSRDETRSAQLENADRCIARLGAVAPLLPVTSLLKGLALERNHRNDEAINAYRLALRGDTRAMAISRMVDLFVRQKRFVDLDLFKEEIDAEAEVDRYSAQVAFRQGDFDRARRVVAQMAEAKPDSPEMQSLQVGLLRELGKPEEAEAYLEGLVDRHPDQPGPWLALVSIRATRGDLALARATVEAASERYQGDRPLLLRARCFFAIGDRDEAAKAVDRLLDAGSDDETTRLAIEFFDAIGRDARVEALLRQALADDPTSSWAAGRLALLLSSASRDSGWAEAWTLIRPGAGGAGDGPADRLIRATVLGRSPDPVRRSEEVASLRALIDDVPATGPVGLEARTRLARAALGSGRPGEAAALLRPAIDDAQVRDPAALATATEALARSGRADEAGRVLPRLVQVDPKSLRTLECRAWTFAAKGNLAAADATVSDALAEAESASPGGVAGTAYVTILVQIGRIDEALALASRIASKDPKQGWIGAGLLADRKEFGRAMQACLSSAKAGGAGEPLRMALLIALGNRQDTGLLAQAGEVADMVVARNPDSPAIINLAAPIRHLQGRYDDEISLYRRLSTLRPDDPVALNNLAWVLSECVNRPEEALSLVDRAAALAGPSPVILDTRGVILGRLGRDDEAIEELEHAVRARPSSSAFYHLARIAWKARKPEILARSRDQARKLGIDPVSLERDERADFAAVMAP